MTAVTESTAGPAGDHAPASSQEPPPEGLTGLARWARERIDARAVDMNDEELARPAVVFAPHQDDETLGCGATILQKRANGAEIAVVFLTDGRQSHHQCGPVADLIARRAAEGREAARRLGVAATEVVQLGFTDGALNADLRAAQAAIQDILRQRQPAQVFVTHHRDRKADHVAAARAVRAAVAGTCPDATVYEYPVWAWQHWPFARWSDLAQQSAGERLRTTLRIWRALRRGELTRVALGECRAAKWRALTAHASQVARTPAQPDWPVLGDVWGGGFLRCFFHQYEIFTRTRGRDLTATL
jgi:LmbE family N-acetylglucosaminyl deacetylase